MTATDARSTYHGLTLLLFVAALVIFIVAALLGFAVFGSVTLPQLVALVSVGEACVVVGVLV